MTSSTTSETLCQATAIIHGTIPTHLAGLMRATAMNLGVPPSKLDAIKPAMDPQVLNDELLRIPVEWAWRAWELIDGTVGPASGLRVASAAERGSLYVWDYLFTSGVTLADSVRTAIELRGMATDPGADWSVEEDGRLLTIRTKPTAEPDDLLASIEEFTLSLVHRRMSEATGHPLVPIRVAFSHSDTQRYPELSDTFGTTRIEFGTPCAEITFLDAGSLPTNADPYLGAMIRHHAELLLARSRSTPDWRGTLRTAIGLALRDGEVSLEDTARRLMLSPRTLQRRLQALGTNWRQEVEAVRHDNAVLLIRDSDLPAQSVAARLGYTDARTLRRAIQRWTGHSTKEFRRRLLDPAVADAVGS
ncbi:helix-turn-helix domain-containing protein [Nocardia sp. NPDC046763]|uniref:helix-turn-helix domain-containing protein n=1 Tax=Nocardia sp. NPDC046763 TaxID=3155256 RepID=UPI00340BACB2